MSNPIVGTPPTPVRTTTGTVAISITVANANDTILICVTGENSSVIALSSILDSAGTVTAVAAYSTVLQSANIGIGWYMVTGAAAGAHTITATFASAINATIAAAELSLVSPTVDVVSAIAHGSSTTPATPAITPVNTGDYLFGAVSVDNLGVTIATWTNSFSQINQQTASGPELAWAWLSAGAPASTSTGATLGSGTNWAASIVSLTPAATAPTVTSGSAIRMSGTAVRIGMAPLMMMPLGWIIERRRRLARKPGAEFARDEKTGLMLPRDPK